MKKLIITNVAYGAAYADLFLNQHLKSMLDPSNIQAAKDNGYEIKYVVFTDHGTQKTIAEHERFKKLVDTVTTRLVTLDVPALKYEERYGVLRFVMRESMNFAITDQSVLSMMVADQIVAKEYLPRILSPIEKGHDAVFTIPMRTAAEPMVPLLNYSDGAVTDMELFSLGYQCLHPLWTACLWRTPMFSKIPYSLIWNSGKGLLVRSFAITPIIFKPKEKMLGCQMIDADVPYLCENPYWATNWTDAPIIGIEPLFCFYPMFSNEKANPRKIKNEFMRALHPSQIDFISQPLYYPSKDVVQMPEEQENEALMVVKELHEK